MIEICSVILSTAKQFSGYCYSVFFLVFMTWLTDLATRRRLLRYFNNFPPWRTGPTFAQNKQ